MGNVIQTNVASLNAQRSLFSTNNSLNQAFQRLSSGFRINSAKDDASGLVISNQLTSQIVGLGVGVRNANDGISVSQVAEGALQEVTNALQRMRELAVQAASGITADGGTEKTALKAEYDALSAEVTRIANQTRFGNQLLLESTSPFTQVGGVDIQVGINAGEVINISTVDITALTSLADDISTAAGASAALAKLSTDITSIDANRGSLGAVQNRLTSTISNLQNIIENASASRSRIRDTDFAVETSNLTKAQVLQQAGLAILAQANASGQSVLNLLQG